MSKVRLAEVGSGLEGAEEVARGAIRRVVRESGRRTGYARSVRGAALFF